MYHLSSRHRRTHRLLTNFGMSAAGAAALIVAYRTEMQEGCAHLRNVAVDEVLRAAFQNRRSLAKPLPGSAKYRSVA